MAQIKFGRGRKRVNPPHMAVPVRHSVPRACSA
jgi:hypothetical protein